jgi:glutamate carboxypeptidase
MQEERWREWLARSADRIAERAERDVAALVGVSSPSGDREAAEEVVAVAGALLPDEAQIERLPCSSRDHADDLLARVGGQGERRLLLLGHLDTVIPHHQHHPIRAEEGRLVGPGTIDMKGGVALSLGLLRALLEQRDSFAEVALLLVVDEEWRRDPFAHAGRFAGHDACLCFEAGELSGDRRDAVIVTRKSAGTVRISARGAAAHSGSDPDGGRNALRALCEVVALAVRHHDPAGADRLTVVPTILRSGEAFNIVPGSGELFLDVRSRELASIEELLASLPAEIDGVELTAELVRSWPGMRMGDRAKPMLERASVLLGREIVGAERGGASDASHLAAGAPLLAIDGLGPLGGGSHAPEEHLLTSSLRSRAEVALAIAATILSGGWAASGGRDL